MNIYESIAALMAEIPAIGKEKRNKEQGFLYRGIDDVMNVLQPLLSKYKVFVVPEVLEQIRETRVTKSGKNMLYSILRIKYTFFAEDGSHVDAIVVGEGMDTADKASNKALAVGMKYALFQVFCIPTEEMVDPDSETPEASMPNTIDFPGGIPQEPTPEPVRCDRCATNIIPIKYKGELYTVEDIVARSKETYNANLCWKCMKDIAAQRAEAAQEAQAGDPDENAG